MLLGFDSAAPELLEEGMADGWLPNLARLRERGVYGRLRSTSEWLVSSHWVSFYLGVPPGEHGCYHFLQWRADAMALRRLDPAWMIGEPFWRRMGAEGVRVVALDVPYTHAPRGRETVELSGWATNELTFSPYASPSRLKQDVHRIFGRSLRESDQGLAFERYSPRPLPELLRTRDQLVEILGRSSRLARELAAREPWDLFLTVLGAPHRAGHLLWSGSSVQGEAGPEAEAALRGALRDVYAATDRAIGELVDAAGADTHVMVFGLIGMAHNTSRTDILPAMLARILAGATDAEAAHEKLRLAKRLRQAIPLDWRHAVKTHLPLPIQDRLSAFWRTGRVDWARTRAVSLTADVHGYIRINLRGREAQGIVEPGRDFDDLCDEIARGLLGFVDSVTGEPVVEGVRRTDEIYPDGSRLAALPDLIVRWAASPCAQTADVVSPRHGRIAWPTPGKNPNGRSGNHTAEGFLIAAGAGIHPGSSLDPRSHILDLAPTVYALLGREAPSFMTGSPLPEIVGGAEPPRRTS
jgi:predicted AlkP superfamily phosphohydrolase/phosphomutase